MTDDILKAGYDAVHEAMPGSPTLRALWREHAAGSDFPDEFYHISFVTLAQLRWMTGELQAGPGSTIADVGCGTGGPALWIARATGASVVGVDFSSAAVAQATARASQLGLSDRAWFLSGTFDQTGLETASVDAIASEDALQYTPDKRAAFAEFARILRPGGRLAFTAFELDPERARGLPVLGVDPAPDYRPLLEGAGFAVDSYEGVPGWSETLRNAYQALLDARPVLAQEMGEPATAALCAELAVTLQAQPYRGRAQASATRR